MMNLKLTKVCGNNANKDQVKVRANSTATIDNKDTSVYTRKSNGKSNGFENDYSHVNMFFYEKTLEQNQNVGIQIETSKTNIIPIETKEVFNKNKGKYQADKIQEEVKEHTDRGCIPEDAKDFDGNKNTESHEHIDYDIDYLAERVYNYKDDEGENLISEVFTKDEVKEKLERKIKENESTPIEEIVQNVEKEMSKDASLLYRTHDRNRKN